MRGIKKRTHVENEMPMGIVIVFIVLVFSVSLFVYGIINFNDSSSVTEESKTPDKLSQNLQEETIEDFFEQEFNKETLSQSDEFIRDDPFVDICAPTSGDSKPALAGNTVCLR